MLSVRGSWSRPLRNKRKLTKRSPRRIKMVRNPKNKKRMLRVYMIEKQQPPMFLYT
jgi:hypothetical protein